MKKKCFALTGLFAIIMLFSVSSQDANSICWKRSVPFDAHCFGDVVTACLPSGLSFDCNEDIEHEQDN